MNLPSKKVREQTSIDSKPSFPHFVKQSSTKKFILSEVFSGANKTSNTEKLITTSTISNPRLNSLLSLGLTYSYGNVANMPAKLTRPSKFCKSFKNSLNSDLFAIETETPKDTETNVPEQEPDSPRKKNKLSPKSIKSKLNLSKGFIADRKMGQLDRHDSKKFDNRKGSERLFIDDLSDSQVLIAGSNENTGYHSISYIDMKEVSSGNAMKDKSTLSPLKKRKKIKLVDRSKSRVVRHKFSPGDAPKVTVKGTSNVRNRHFAPGKKADPDGLVHEDKHRDYKLNNLFKMMEFLEKDQNLSSNRLELRVVVSDQGKSQRVQQERH